MAAPRQRLERPRRLPLRHPWHQLAAVAEGKACSLRLAAALQAPASPRLPATLRGHLSAMPLQMRRRSSPGPGQQAQATLTLKQTRQKRAARQTLSPVLVQARASRPSPGKAKARTKIRRVTAATATPATMTMMAKRAMATATKTTRAAAARAQAAAQRAAARAVVGGEVALLVEAVAGEAAPAVRAAALAAAVAEQLLRALMAGGISLLLTVLTQKRSPPSKRRSGAAPRKGGASAAGSSLRSQRLQRQLAPLQQPRKLLRQPLSCGSRGAPQLALALAQACPVALLRVECRVRTLASLPVLPATAATQWLQPRWLPSVTWRLLLQLRHSPAGAALLSRQGQQLQQEELFCPRQCTAAARMFTTAATSSSTSTAITIIIMARDQCMPSPRLRPSLSWPQAAAQPSPSPSTLCPAASRQRKLSRALLRTQRQLSRPLRMRPSAAC